MRPLVVYGDGPWAPTVDPATVAALCDLEGPDVVVGWTVEELPWLEASPAGRVTSVSAGYRLRPAVTAGMVQVRSTAISAMPALLADGLRPDVVVVSGRPSGTGFAFGPSVGWAHAAARLARRGVVVDVRPEMPAYDAPPVPGDILATVEGPVLPLAAPGGRAPSAAEEAIGAAVAELIPPGATLEFGLGTVCDAAAGALRVGVRIRSGMVTDTLVRLDRQGLLLDRAEATYAWGGDDLAALSAAGRLRIVPSDLSHDIDRLAGLELFTAVNSALEVGLDGAVNVEVLDGKPVSGIGGHADFCAAAARSEGGLSIVALTATRRGRSAIVPAVEHVSTPGSDVHVVVTEYGVADLRGADAAERRRRLLGVAAPEHRQQLAGA